MQGMTTRMTTCRHAFRTRAAMGGLAHTDSSFAMRAVWAALLSSAAASAACVVCSRHARSTACSQHSRSSVCTHGHGAVPMAADSDASAAAVLRGCLHDVVVVTVRATALRVRAGETDKGWQ